MDRTDLTGLYTSANTVGLGNLMSFSGVVGASSCESPILDRQTRNREARRGGRNREATLVKVRSSTFRENPGEPWRDR